MRSSFAGSEPCRRLCALLEDDARSKSIEQQIRVLAVKTEISIQQEQWDDAAQSCEEGLDKVDQLTAEQKKNGVIPRLYLQKAAILTGKQDFYTAKMYLQRLQEYPGNYLGKHMIAFKATALKKTLVAELAKNFLCASVNARDTFVIAVEVRSPTLLEIKEEGLGWEWNLKQHTIDFRATFQPCNAATEQDIESALLGKHDADSGPASFRGIHILVSSFES